MNTYTGLQTVRSQARGGGRRRIHRPGDGRKPRPPRAGSDADRKARPGHASARSGDGALVERYLVKHGVRLELNDGVAGFEQSADGAMEVLTSSGKRLRPTS